MALTLEHAFTIRCLLNPSTPTVLGPGSGRGDRIIAPIDSGVIEFVKSGIKAELVAPSADWLILDQINKRAYFDVRLRAKTGAGEVYIQYKGHTILDEAATKIFSFSPEAKSTAFGDSPWAIIPTLETSDEQLKPLETVQLLGQGRWTAELGVLGVEYAVYAVPQGSRSGT